MAMPKGHRKYATEELRLASIKRSMKKYWQTMPARYSLTKAAARRRDMEFSITLEQYAELKTKPCWYCGTTKMPTIGGLDRLDNSIGYHRSNVIPCCTACNQIRGHNLTVEEMKAVADFLNNYRSAKEC